MVCGGSCLTCPVAYSALSMVAIGIKRIYRKPMQKKRLVSQLIFLFITNAAFIFGVTGLIYSYFYCWESPQATMSCPIGILEHAVLEASIFLAIYLVGTIAIIGTIFGRAPCGWACPIGFLQDVVGKIKISREIKRSKADERARYLKYAILAAIPFAVYHFATMAYTDICPIGGLTATLPILLFHYGGYTPTEFFLPKMILLALTIFLIVNVKRGWCRYLCPVGAMLAPFNKISVLQLTFYESQCLKCMNCARVCPMKINLPYDVKSMECIRCGMCVDECPTEALKLEFKWK